MATKSYSLKLMSDGILTIKVGRAVEHIRLVHKDKGQIFDDVKWALVSKDAFVSNERLTQDLWEIIWQHLPPQTERRRR